MNIEELAIKFIKEHRVNISFLSKTATARISNFVHNGTINDVALCKLLRYLFTIGFKVKENQQSAHITEEGVLVLHLRNNEQWNTVTHEAKVGNVAHTIEQIAYCTLVFKTVKEWKRIDWAYFDTPQLSVDYDFSAK